MAERVGQYPGERRGHGWIITLGGLILLALIYIFPFLVQVANSFKSDAEATSAGLALWSANWTTEAYHVLFNNSDFGLWTMNSLIVTVAVTLGRVFFVS
ncbi:MAG: carbohydrate ABC transporter permease, partial [Propionibacterium sp.]|nr:carbohydrate ABC transporter permease [Propionibacterium sp.]